MHAYLHRAALTGAIALAFSPALASAQIAPPPPAPSLATVNVTDTCTPAASNGTTKTYSGSFLGICALVAAKDQGAVTSYDLSYDPSLGFFLNSLNGIAPVGNQFWDIQQNQVDSSVGLSSMSITTGDVVGFILEQCDSNWLHCASTGTSVSFKIGTLTATAAPVTTASTGGGGSVGPTVHPPFDVDQAMQYLMRMQQSDGSFGSPMLNDWVAVGSAIGGYGDLRSKLAAYESSHLFSAKITTENERHAMALEALGLNPYTTGGDYITPIVQSFDGTQIGDPSLINDDIFALFPLLHAGYTAHDDLIAKTAAHVIAQQSTDGSWAASTDLTAAAVQALALTPSIDGDAQAIRKALSYLHAKQLKDGGIGDPFATAWLLQAIAATQGSVSEWQQGINTPDYYLAVEQQQNGKVGTSTDVSATIWATAYAIPAVKRMPWDTLLPSFPRPVLAPVALAATTTDASSTTTVTQASGPAPETNTTPVRETPSTSAAATDATSTPPAAITDELATTSLQAAAAASVSGHATWPTILLILAGVLAIFAIGGISYSVFVRR